MKSFLMKGVLILGFMIISLVLILMSNDVISDAVSRYLAFSWTALLQGRVGLEGFGMLLVSGVFLVMGIKLWFSVVTNVLADMFAYCFISLDEKK